MTKSKAAKAKAAASRSRKLADAPAPVRRWNRAKAAATPPVVSVPVSAPRVTRRPKKFQRRMTLPLMPTSFPVLAAGCRFTQEYTIVLPIGNRMLMGVSPVGSQVAYSIFFDGTNLSGGTPYNPTFVTSFFGANNTSAHRYRWNDLSCTVTNVTPLGSIGGTVNVTRLSQPIVDITLGSNFGTIETAVRQGSRSIGMGNFSKPRTIRNHPIDRDAADFEQIAHSAIGNTGWGAQVWTQGTDATPMLWDLLMILVTNPSGAGVNAADQNLHVTFTGLVQLLPDVTSYLSTIARRLPVGDPTKHFRNDPNERWLNLDSSQGLSRDPSHYLGGISI